MHMDAAEGEREGGVEGSCGTITHKILTFHFAAIEVNIQLLAQSSSVPSKHEAGSEHNVLSCKLPGVLFGEVAQTGFQNETKTD